MKQHVRRIGWPLGLALLAGVALLSVWLWPVSAAATPTRTHTFAIDMNHVWTEDLTAPGVVATLDAVGTWDEGATIEIYGTIPGGGPEVLGLKGGVPAAGSAEDQHKVTAMGIGADPSGTTYRAVFKTYDASGNVNWTAQDVLTLP